jgi:two-component system response regulator NreC
MSQQVSFLIADDHQIILDGLSKIIESQADWRVIATATDGKSAIEKIEILEPDLVLLDIDMPLANGIEVAKTILSKAKRPKIIMLTMHQEISLTKKMIDLGVDGFLVKNTDQQELMLGIRQVLKGKKYIHADALSSSKGSHSIKPSDDAIDQLDLLSKREVEVLKGIATGRTSQEIADELFISIRTVDTHRKNIHEKLNTKRIADLIRIALQSGLIS